MSLKEILYDTVGYVTDAYVAGVFGTDGIGVDMLLDIDAVPHDVQSLEIELAYVVSSMTKSTERLSLGNLYELSMQTDELTYFLSQITSGYYAVIGVSPDSNVERARFALWQMVSRCLSEL